MINSISAVTNTTLTEYRSEMVPMINKNEDQPMSLEFSDSYYEDFEITYPKKKKAKQQIPTPMTCQHYLKIVQKIIIMAE